MILDDSEYKTVLQFTGFNEEWTLRKSLISKGYILHIRFREHDNKNSRVIELSSFNDFMEELNNYVDKGIPKDNTKPWWNKLPDWTSFIPQQLNDEYKEVFINALLEYSYVDFDEYSNTIVKEWLRLLG